MSIWLRELSGSDHFTLRQLLEQWWLEPNKFADFLNGLNSFGENPQPQQGEIDDAEEYEGQPIVWDGMWEFRPAVGEKFGGEFWFVGANGVSGGYGDDPHRERKVGLDEVILFY